MGNAAATTPIIDIDTHIPEPPDLWTSRLPVKWRDQASHAAFNPSSGVEGCFAGGMRLVSPGFSAMAAHNEHKPNFLKSYAALPKGAWQSKARLESMDTGVCVALSDDVVHKVLWDNPATLCGVAKRAGFPG